MKEKSWVLEAPEKMVLKEFDIPEVDSDGMLLKVTMVSICGSDPHYYYGRQNTEYLPMILGHEVVGIVEEIGAEAEKAYGVKKGDRVGIEPYMNCGECEFCQKGYYQLCRNSEIYGCKKSCNDDKHLWGGYGQYMYVGKGSHIYKIADGIPDEAAVFFSVVGNGYRMVKTKGEVTPDDTVVIFGPGALGLCACVAAKNENAKKIIMVGLRSDEMRLELAKEFGADEVIYSDECDVVETITKLTDGKLADVCIECTGAPIIYNWALLSTKDTGIVVLLGLNSKKDVPIYTDRIIQHELTVKGCLGQPHNCDDAIKLINSGKFPIEKMATHHFDIDKADEAFQFAVSKDPSLIRVVMHCDKEF